MNNELKVRCTKDGISIEGARDIGSTSDTIVDSLSQFLRIAECWWFTYCEKSPIQEANCHGNEAAMRYALANSNARMESKKICCAAQEWTTRVMGLCVEHEIPICRRSGFNCWWVGDEIHCNRCDLVQKGETDGSK